MTAAYLERKGKPTLYYEVDDFTDPWRDAPTMVLQHGFGRSSRFWYSWVPYLSRFYKVVRPDLRGFGQSPADFDLENGFTVEGLVEDLVAIIDTLGAGSVHYCGESFGGLLGMVLAGIHSDRVRTLSLVSAPVYINDQGKKAVNLGYPSVLDAVKALGVKGWCEAVNSGLRFSPETDPGLLGWYVEEMSKCNIEALDRLSRLIVQTSVEPYLAQIKAPVLALYPSSGTITSREQEELLRRRLRDVRFVHLLTHYHAILNSAPATCAMNVLHFAGQHDGIPCLE